MDNQKNTERNIPQPGPTNPQGDAAGNETGGRLPQPGRRKILPILGGGLLLPLLPVRAAGGLTNTKEEEAGYKTLLKPDGTAVRVPLSKLKKARVVRKNISNRELLGWLKSKKDR